MDDGSRTHEQAPTHDDFEQGKTIATAEKLRLAEAAIIDYTEQLETETDEDERAILKNSIATMEHIRDGANAKIEARSRELAEVGIPLLEAHLDQHQNSED